MYLLEDYIKAFKLNSIKITPQRLAIFNLLVGNTNHPTADDLYKEILKIQPSISFATVYNSLDKLVELGLLQKLDIDDEKKHYDPDLSLHHHFLCKKCKQIIDVFEDFKIHIDPAKFALVSLDSYQVNFFGQCSKCI